MFKLQCGNCGHKLAVPTTYAGQKIKCPKCTGPITVPASQPPAKAVASGRRPTPRPATPQAAYAPGRQGPGAYPAAPAPDIAADIPRPRRRHQTQRTPVNSTHMAIVIGGVVLLLAILVAVIIYVADAKQEERQRIEREHNAKLQEIEEANERRRKQTLQAAQEGNKDIVNEEQQPDQQPDDDPGS